MANERYGVDSVTRANVPLRGQCCGQTYYDYVTSAMGQAPAFWGRYLINDSGIGIDGLTTLNSDGTLTDNGEYDFLVGKGCNILLIDDQQHSHRSLATDGETHAQNALYAARQLGVPTGNYIFLDIESGTPVTSAYLNAYVNTLDYNGYGYTAGFYTSSSYVCTVNNAFNCDGRVLYIAKYVDSSHPTWNEAPCIPAGCEVIWQYKGGNPGYYLADTIEGTTGVDLDVAPTADVLAHYMSPNPNNPLYPQTWSIKTGIWNIYSNYAGGSIIGWVTGPTNVNVLSILWGPNQCLIDYCGIQGYIPYSALDTRIS